MELFFLVPGQFAPASVVHCRAALVCINLLLCMAYAGTVTFPSLSVNASFGATASMTVDCVWYDGGHVVLAVNVLVEEVVASFITAPPTSTVSGRQALLPAPALKFTGATSGRLPCPPRPCAVSPSCSYFSLPLPLQAL
jgi:hypothetical protein